MFRGPSLRSKEDEAWNNLDDLSVDSEDDDFEEDKVGEFKGRKAIQTHEQVTVSGKRFLN